MTVGHVIVGSSAHESQERETNTFCSQQVLLFGQVNDLHLAIAKDAMLGVY